MSLINCTVHQKYSMAAFLGNTVQDTKLLRTCPSRVPLSSLAMAPTQTCHLVSKVSVFPEFLPGFPFLASSDGEEFLLKNVHQLITFQQVYFAMYTYTGTIYSMLTNTGKVMYLSHFPCVLQPRSLPPCTSSPNFPRAAADQIPQHPAALSTYRTRQQDAKGNETDKGTHQGDYLRVGKGFVCLFVYLVF